MSQELEVKEVEWRFEKAITVIEEYAIYGLIANFLQYNNQFRNMRERIQKEIIAGCQLCSTPFEEGQSMTLALNRGKHGNLLVCDTCCEEAVSKGVHCNYRNGKGKDAHDTN